MGILRRKKLIFCGVGRTIFHSKIFLYFSNETCHMKKTLFILFNILFFSFTHTHAHANNENEVANWQIQAMQGDVNAQYELGKHYQKNQQDDAAETWFEQAAAQGHRAAQTQYAWYRYAVQDYDNAAYFYKLAAEQNDAEAQFHMGLLHERGDGVEKLPETALRWYEKAAKQAHPPAQTRLGWLHEHGVYVPKNAVLAAKWYEKAAKLGYADAQFNLAALLDEQNRFQAAALWYEKAATQNHAKALFNLAVLYQDGNGVPKNTSKVRALLQQAAQLGLPEAQAALEK